MSLLDWLSDGLGLGNAAAMGGGDMPPGIYPGGGAIDMPPVQMTGMDAPSLADPMTQAMPGGQGAGPLPPDPALDAMPSIQGGGLPQTPTPAAPVKPPTNLVPDPAALPPNAQPTAGLNPATLTSFMGPGQKPAAGSTGILESALGLSPERAKEVRASLASGLKSVGDNWNKPGLAAFSASAGAGLEGAEKHDLKQTDQRMKFLNAAVAAQAAGDRAAYNKNYSAYLKAKLDSEINTASGGGKKGKGALSPEKMYLEASKSLSVDPQIKAAQHGLEAAQRAGDPKAVAQAQAAFDKLFEAKRAETFAATGVNPKTIADLVKNPPGTKANPFKPMTQQDLEQYLKPGDYFVNPKDQRVLIYRGAKGAAATGNPTPAVTMPPAPPGPMPSPMGVPSTEEE